MFSLWLLFLCLKLFSKTAAIHHNSLQNRQLKVAAEPWRPFFVIYCDKTELAWDEKCPEKGKLTYGGALWDLLKFIQQARNVTFLLMRGPSYEWGVCYGKNNCTGMIGMVDRKEVDFAIGTVCSYFEKNSLGESN